MINLLETIDEQLLHFEVKDKVTKEDVESVIKVVDEMYNKHGKIRAIGVLKDFHGYTVDGFFADMHFGLSHKDTFSHLAIVGENKIEEALTKIGSLFMKGQVKYFDMSDMEKAMDWVSVKEKV